MWSKKRHVAMSEGSISSSNTSLFTRTIVFLTFALIGLLLYGHTLQVPFYLDDFINIKDCLYSINSLSLNEFVNAFFEGFAPRRPLSNLSFALNYYFHGFHLPGYHVVNIIIHVMNGVLLFLFIYKTITLNRQRHKCRHPEWAAVLASMLWFVNPVQIQSVTYIVQRMTSMATLFFLSSFLLYLYARLVQKGLSRELFIGSSVLCWILSVMSKEIALTLPGLIFFYEWFFFQDLSRAWFKKSAIYIIAGVVSLLTAAHVVYHYTPLDFLTSIYQPRTYTALERFLTEGRVIFIYMSLLLYPHPSRLTLNHDISISHGLVDPLTTLMSFVGLFAMAALTVLVAKRYRIVSFCMIWFFANVAIEALAAGTEPMFEHRMYLPSMLFFVPFVWIAFRSINKPKIIVPVITALLIVFSFWTFQRNTLWTNPVDFWGDAARKSPNHYRTYANLGISYLNAKSYQDSIEAFQKALSLNPPYPTEIYTNIGLLYMEMGQPNLARQNLDRAVFLNANNYVAIDHLGTIYRKQKDYAKAVKYYEMAIKMNPNFAPSHHNLGLLYMDMGLTENAVRSFQQAITLRPKSTKTYSSLGLAWATQGRYDLAIPTLLKAIRFDAKNHEALFNLAKVYDLTGRHEMAAKQYKTLIGIRPKDVEAMHNLGIIYLKHLKNVEQARLYFSKALVTDPEYEHAEVARNILSQIAVKP